jgi:hypothetical protein
MNKEGGRGIGAITTVVSSKDGMLEIGMHKVELRGWSETEMKFAVVLRINSGKSGIVDRAHVFIVACLRIFEIRAR